MASYEVKIATSHLDSLDFQLRLVQIVWAVVMVQTYETEISETLLGTQGCNDYVISLVEVEIDKLLTAKRKNSSRWSFS